MADCQLNARKLASGAGSVCWSETRGMIYTFYEILVQRLCRWWICSAVKILVNESHYSIVNFAQTRRPGLNSILLFATEEES